ncbi:hypothetical protein HZS_7768 [Henneguya salminicola]|nr:hypothetical protein HZS_7768 [Henneguya salminicola]
MNYIVYTNINKRRSFKISPFVLDDLTKFRACLDSSPHSLIRLSIDISGYEKFKWVPPPKLLLPMVAFNPIGIVLQ